MTKGLNLSVLSSGPEDSCAGCYDPDVLVSIVIPLHNKGPFIRDTLISLSSQTHLKWEAIVVENGSTDDGPDVVAQFLDARISMIVAPAIVTGPGAARNVGLDLAKGDWILFLDADDLLESDYLQRRLGDAQGRNIVAGPWKEFSDLDPSRKTTMFPSNWNEERSVSDSAFAFAPWAIHAALVKRCHLDSRCKWVVALDDLPSEDCAFWFPLVFNTEISWSAHAGALYRKQTVNSRDSSTNDPAIAFAACRRTVRQNERYLWKHATRPSDTQAAYVVRVMTAILRRTRRKHVITKAIKSEIRYWLTFTRMLDFKMLAYRVMFREFKSRRSTNRNLRQAQAFGIPKDSTTEDSN